MSGPDVAGSGAWRRRRRALAARHLLALHEEGALADPDRWDWDTLGELPAWCLLGEAERVRLQHVAGVVFLAPALARVLDGAVFRAVGELVGEAVLDGALDGAFDGALDGVSGAGPGAPVPSADAVELVAKDVDGQVRGAGATVLLATLGARLERVLPLDALRAALGPASGELERVTAERVLTRAETLLLAADGPAPVGPLDAAVDRGAGADTALVEGGGTGAARASDVPDGQPDHEEAA